MHFICRMRENDGAYSKMVQVSEREAPHSLLCCATGMRRRGR